MSPWKTVPSGNPHKSWVQTTNGESADITRSVKFRTQLCWTQKLLSKENEDVITFRIVEALDERTGMPHYWVFAVGNGTTHMVCSNVTRKRALETVFDRVTSEDIVESISTIGLKREEFGSEFQSRVKPYLVPKE